MDWKTRWAFNRAWIHAHKRDIAALATVLIGIAVFGAVMLNPEEKVGYERATVTYVGVREGSKSPGVRMQVALADKRRIWIDSRAYNPSLEPGREICVLKTRGKWRRATFYRLALPRRCLDAEAALARTGGDAMPRADTTTTPEL